MAKLQVRLLVVIVLGTISWCEEVGGSSPKVYQRVTVRNVHIEFAMNTSVSLPSDSLSVCAKAAARAAQNGDSNFQLDADPHSGLDAFVFNGSCTGYLLNLHFLKCQTGDLTVYVLPDYVIEEPVLLPANEAPFKSHEQNRRKYMLSALVETGFNHPALLYTRRVSFDFYYTKFDMFYRENGDTYFLNGLIVDMNFCLSDGSYGLLFDVLPAIYDFPGDILFFFEECGNTVQVRKYISPEYLLVLSHPGFGCQYYPSELPDECTVTFQLEDSGILNAAGFSFYFPETDSDDGGLNMTITGEDPKTGTLESLNMYRKNYRQNMQYKSTIEISLLRQPSKRAIGFYAMFVPYLWGTK